MNQTASHRDYQGFSLQSVCWGYRDIFANTIESLFAEGCIGGERREVTTTFFDFLKQADRQHFDYVLKEFICALNPDTNWIMEIPGIFTEVVELGGQLAQTKMYYGLLYFKTLGEGGFGRSPAQVRYLMSALRRLRKIDDELAIALLKGYRRLLDRLNASELDLYINEGLKVFTSNKPSGLKFLEGTLKSSDAILNALTQECRLKDMHDSLEALINALVGYEVEVADLSQLDEDELLERDTRLVGMYRWVYMSPRIRYFDQAVHNRNWYRLLAVVAAGMLVENSFCRLHGHPDFVTCTDVVGNDLLNVNLFQMVEYARVLRRIRQRWPGAGNLLDFGLRTEFSNRPPRTLTDLLIYDVLLSPRNLPPVTAPLVQIIDSSVNLFDTANQIIGKTRRLGSEWRHQLVVEYPDLARCPLRTFYCLPDFLYAAIVSRPPKEELIADLKQEAEARHLHDQQEQSPENQSPLMSKHETLANSSRDEEQPDSEQEGVTACFLYDEWSQPDHDYYRNYCQLYEHVPRVERRMPVPIDLLEAANQIRRVFELLKPDVVRNEKYLSDGDCINPDLLVQYLVQRKQEPAPKIDFYEKPSIQHRDMAVLILLDVSGSTGEKMEQEKVIDLEKQAAIILGQGLHTLGDRFAVCGFSGNGREHCDYYHFKHFDDTWNPDTIGRILAARPLGATRIGAALRHAGCVLSRIEAKQRLIMLVTDGRPMDRDYDHKTRYAQYDVRVACEENKRQAIYTFCISTEENSRADMEIMFPEQRFVILSDMRQLPRVLPRLYIKMTT